MYIRNLGIAVLGLSALSTPSVAHSAVTDKADLAIQRELKSPHRKGWTSVIVRTEGTPTVAQEAGIAALGGDVYRHLPIINSLAVRIPSRSLGKLAALPFVSRLSSDMEVKKTDEFTVGHSGADVAWSYGLTGTGVGVAVLDSGVSSLHPDLFQGYSSRVVQGLNLVADGSLSGDPCGHGTHVAGILAGNGAASGGTYSYRTFKGIAPTAKIVSVRVLDKQGSGTVSNSIAGIQWVIANKAA
ncbi:S8 family serine peptidase, partial [Armatimonas sp.]|uniref:S8 family serine peptidase n=1 Tax=Armatimonas sp. TaxID=1872638 RepID=UPI003750DD99